MIKNIRFGYYKWQFGVLKIGYNEENYIVLIKNTVYIDEKNEPNYFTNLVYNQIIEYLAGQRKIFSFNYKLEGTDFQKKVWKKLCEIPYGQTKTYSQIAEEIKNPKAVRAVGMANNKNPLCIVVPCHRVIGKNGKLIGYAGGIDMKKSLLDIEHKNQFL